MADKKLQQLIINKGTEAKFNALPVKSDEQLYFITDSDTYVTKTELSTKIPTPPTTAGNYILTITVAEDGTTTTQWVILETNVL